MQVCTVLITLIGIEQISKPQPICIWFTALCMGLNDGLGDPLGLLYGLRDRHPRGSNEKGTPMKQSTRAMEATDHVCKLTLILCYRQSC